MAFGRTVSAHPSKSTAALLMFVCACATSRASADVTYQLIADQSTPAPTGFETGKPLSDFGEAVIDNGNIAFAAGVGSGLGVYTSNNGQLQTLVDPSTSFPGPHQNLNGIDGLNISGSNYAFFDGTASSTGSYFSIINGAFTQVTGPIADIDNPVVVSDRVWFTVVNGGTGNSAGADGLYYETSGAAATQVIPFTSSLNRQLSDSAPIAVNNGNVLIGTLGPLYKYSSSTGQLTDLVDNTMPAPGGVGNFSSITKGPYSLSYDGSEIGFEANDSQSNPGYYLDKNGIITALAINGAPAPGGGTFAIPTAAFIAAISVDSGHVAFETSDATPSSTDGLSDSAIYTDAAGDGLQRLIGVGDMLDGQQVSGVSMTNQALSGSQLVFFAQFTDGDQGIFLANLPEPACLSVLALGGLLTLPRRRKSK
jgi:hypothetical protein